MERILSLEILEVFFQYALLESINLTFKWKLKDNL